MATVRDLGIAAMKELGVLAPGEVPTAADAQDFLDALNRMIDQWAAERLQIFTELRTFWAITPSVQTWTLGTTGTVPMQRPETISHVNYSLSVGGVGTEYPLTQLTDEAWANLSQKNLTATVPTHWWYSPQFPLGVLQLWPNPTSSGLTGNVYAPRAVAQFLTINDTVSLPPGYTEMIVTNLALRLAPSYTVEPSSTLVRAAINAKAVVKAANHTLSDLSFPAEALIGNRGSWSIYNG